MNHDVPTATTEILQPKEFELPAEYEFASVANIEQLRSKQFSAEIDARNKGLASSNMYTATNEALATLAGSVEDDAEHYVAAHMNRDDNPELFDRLKSLIADTSYHRVKGEEWHLGETDADGNHTRLETSGKSRYEAALQELFGLPEEPADDPDEEPDDPAPPLPSPEDIETAEAALEDARTRLADLSVQRRRMLRKGGKKAKALEEQFDEAQKAYEDARIARGKLEVQTWLHHRTEPAQLRAKVISHLLDEHQSFTKAEADILANDPSLKARFARRLAAHKKMFALANGVTGFGIGFGLGKVTKGILGLAGAVTLPAALGAGVAIKTTKAVLQSSVGNRIQQHHTHDKRAAQDQRELRQEADKRVNTSKPIDEMLLSANGLLSGRIHNRVHKDIRSNRVRVLGAAVIGGAAGAAGFLVSSELSGNWPFDNHDGTSQQHDGTSHASGNNGEHSGHTQHDGGENKPNHEPQKDHDNTHHEKKSGVIDGYQTHVKIASGEGYTQALSDLANQKDIHLAGEQSWKLYEHLNKEFNGKFLTNDASYRMSDGNWGISRPGNAHWNPAVVHEMNRWMHENGYYSKTAKKAAKTVLNS